MGKKCSACGYSIGLFNASIECRRCRRSFCRDHSVSLLSTIEQKPPQPLESIEVCEECAMAYVQDLLKRCAGRKYYTLYEECSQADSRSTIHLIFSEELDDLASRQNVDFMERFPLGLLAAEWVGRLAAGMSMAIDASGTQAELVTAERMLQLKARLG